MNTDIDKALKLTTAGNYFGYYKGHYVFATRRPHGGFSCHIGKRGQWLHSEGNFGTSMPEIEDVKKWVISMFPEWAVNVS